MFKALIDRWQISQIKQKHLKKYLIKNKNKEKKYNILLKISNVFSDIHQINENFRGQLENNKLTNGIII